MKRWIWLLAVLAVFFLNGKRPDVADLQPVEVVMVDKAQGMIQIHTDTGDSGRGTDLKSAVDNLKATSPAEVFLETGEYLLLPENCLSLLPELMEYLRPSCMVCIVRGEPELESVAQYLKIHPPKLTLAKYRAGMVDWQTLTVEKGRMELVS